MLIDRRALRRLVRARELLASDDARTVGDVARAIAISPFHFSRQFDALFGTTPHQFRIEARLARAKALLAAGESVTDACFAVGFSSLGSFSTLFARRVGVPPSAFRRVRVAVPADVRPALVPGCFGLLGGLPRDAFRRNREASPS